MIRPSVRGWIDAKAKRSIAMLSTVPAEFVRNTATGRCRPRRARDAAAPARGSPYRLSTASYFPQIPSPKIPAIVQIRLNCYRKFCA